MRLLITLTEAMAANLLAECSHERRPLRQQAEVLLEQALERVRVSHEKHVGTCACEPDKEVSYE
jgi:hypothetical protein